MKKSKRRSLLYEELKSDEKRLIQWYRENPISVYIEIALIKLLIWEIITEIEYKKYQLEVVKKAAILKSIARNEVRNITDKNELKDLSFKMLNENGKLFSDVSRDDETMIELWAKKNSELMSVALGVKYIRDLGVFTEEETNKYLSEIVGMAK